VRIERLKNEYGDKNRVTDQRKPMRSQKAKGLLHALARDSGKLELLSLNDWRTTSFNTGRSEMWTACDPMLYLRVL
jgi:hypothetical protein